MIDYNNGIHYNLLHLHLNFLCMSNELQKPVIGFSCGDLNGIGLELIIKTLSDSRLLDVCVPVVFASNKSINFYRKALPEINISYQAIKEVSRINVLIINRLTFLTAGKKKFR